MSLHACQAEAMTYVIKCRVPMIEVMMSDGIVLWLNT